MNPIARIRDDVDQLAARAERLVATGQVPVATIERLVGEGVAKGAPLYERIIAAAADHPPAGFLSRGARAVAAVARISAGPPGRETPLGTGFMVSPRLLLTTSHVLPSPAAAGGAVAEFGGEEGAGDRPGTPVRFRLDPDGCFLTDERLGYTLVLVKAAADGSEAGAILGWNPLVARQGKIVAGEPVNMAGHPPGHPPGRATEISVRHSRLREQTAQRLLYTTGGPGGSGSPVFNDQWEVVALHHGPADDSPSPGAETDEEVRGSGVPGSGLRGSGVRGSGVRVSVILAHLAGREVTAGVRALLAEMGPAAGLGTPAVPVARPPAVQPLRAPATALAARPTAFGGGRRLLFLPGGPGEHRDHAGPVALRRQWTAGLNKGLTLADLPTLDPGDVWLPFYADRLVPAGPEPSAGCAAPTSPTARLLYEQLVGEAAMMAGMPSDSRREGLLTGLDGALSWLASATNLDRLLIARVFRDVAAYLDDPPVRHRVLDAVLRTLPRSGALVMVAHGLGSVVAMDLMASLPPGVEVPLLVTAGSPLGLDAVHRHLLAGGPARPPRIGAWLNVWCPSDPVCIGCPLDDDWKGQVDERAVDNPLQRAHDVEEYLSDPAVARAVAAALA
ncbi:trypsin-like peptidase domain-containing protein [Nonomuraea sp. NPDC003804]|uniref:trypsin-like serine peptidase n=1 Tax=Nonomuraea sp. NPDC003804 TaxID=3154547 RepID=UPI0033ADE5DC